MKDLTFPLAALLGAACGLLTFLACLAIGVVLSVRDPLGSDLDDPPRTPEQDEYAWRCHYWSEAMRN